MSLPDPQESAGTRNAAAGSDVFVSHSSKDREAADAVSRALESRGIRCWMAPRDIRPGANWGESILEAIGKVKMMVLLLSANANASPQVLREVERAVNKSVVIIPVRIENVMPSASLEYFLSTAHWLDAFESPLDQHCRNLADTVQGMLRGKDFTPFASVPPAGPARRTSRAWLTPVAGVLGVLAIAAASFVAGNWWRRAEPLKENSPAEVPLQAPVFASSSPAAVSAASTSPAQRPVPAIADFAGQWEIVIVNIEDVEGNSASYGPIRFTVSKTGEVAGKAALQMEERRGRFLSHRPPLVLDLKGSISAPAWKNAVPFPFSGGSQNLGYNVANIAFKLGDGAEGSGTIGFSDHFPVAEHITIKKGEAFGRMHASRTGPLEDAAASPLRVEPLRSGDVMTDGAWWHWSLPDHMSDGGRKVAEMDMSTGQLVLRINGNLERLDKVSQKWTPLRDLGPVPGDGCEEIWSNSRARVLLSFNLDRADGSNELTVFSGKMQVSYDGQTADFTVRGETGS